MTEVIFITFNWFILFSLVYRRRPRRDIAAPPHTEATAPTCSAHLSSVLKLISTRSCIRRCCRGIQIESRKVDSGDLVVMQSQTVSVSRLQGGATANFLADVAVGRLQGAATANFLAGVLVGHLQGAATSNFLAGVSVGRL